ncbi:DNA primase [candidate division WOR-3 bacterium]|nr:DNA primase [candidate division WOR-3 bacterium]
MRISQDKIVEIREANPIEEVIGNYIPLKKAGKNYKGLCPFHLEKAPSFIVSPEKGIYHCFGCGKSGNVFTFLMEYNNMSFYEAVRELGNRVGIRVEVVEDANKELYRANEFVASLYHSILLSESGTPGHEWLRKRGILDDTANKFMLGYAPEQPIIWNKAKTNGFKQKDFEVLGLLIGVRDAFRRKVIFPIRDRLGRVVGFGSRVLDDSEPKYINSKESLIFKKRRLLYGAYESRSELRKGATLVEGYMDLLSVYQTETKNVVASLGTSFAQEQARYLKGYTKSVIIAYDGDDAGHKATERAIDILLEEGFDVKVLRFPDGDDPDSWVKKHEKLDLSEAQSFMEFKFKECSDITEKETLIREFQETLSKIADPLKKELWADEISKKLEIRKEFLVIEKVVPKRNRVAENKKLEDLEAELLGIAATYPKVREFLIKEKFEVLTEELKTSLALVLQGEASPEVLSSISSEKLRERFTDVLFREDTDYEKLGKDYLNRIRAERTKIERKGLSSEKINKGESEILRKFQDLKRQELFLRGG